MSRNGMVTPLHDVRPEGPAPDATAASAPADGKLLRAFIETRDEAAFEAIVRRHGQMVLSVCRRLLGNEHDAADAFQAVFLVLARKAAGIRTPDVLGAWLYNVAYRTSMKARAVIYKRKTREGQVIAMPEPAVECEAVDDVLEVLDHELRALPEKYQQAVILCDLQGQSRKEAAAALKLAEGTLSSRLATARKKLADRLRRRGVTVSATALGAILAQSVASASVPAPLLATAVQSAGPAALGQAGSASANAILLSDAVVKAMFLSKLKIVALAMLAPFLLGAALQVGVALVADEPDDQTAALATLKKLGARLEWELGPGKKQLARIDLNRTQVRDEHLPMLDVFKGLKELWLNDTVVSDAGCEHLLRLPNLQSLKLVRSKIGDAGLKSIAAIPKLRALGIGGTGVTDQGLAALSAAPELRELDVRGTGIGDAGLKNIARIQKLNKLELGKTKITDKGMKELLPLQQLRTLWLDDNALTDAGLPDIAAIRSLESLSFQGVPGVTDAGVKLLAPLELLHAINLSGTRTTDTGVRDLAVFKSLGWLYLEHTAVTGAGFENPADFSKLETLSLRASKSSDFTVATVAGVGSLRTLNLENTAVTDAGVKHLTRLPRLESLVLQKTEVTDACLRDLASFPQLWLLNVSSTKVTDAGLPLIAAFPQLRWLGLHDTAVTDAGLKHLTPMRNLDTLWVSWTKVTNEGLKHIAAHKNLQTLRLGGCKVTDEGLKTLAPLTNLRILWLDWTKVTDAGLKELAPLSKIEELRFDGAGGVTDAGLQHLAALKNLKTVDAQQTGVTQAAIGQLQTALPNVAVNTEKPGDADAPGEDSTHSDRGRAFWWLFACLGVLSVGGLIGWRSYKRQPILVPTLVSLGMAGLMFLGYHLLEVLTPARAQAPAAQGAAADAGPKTRLLKGHTGPVQALRFTPDMKTLISTSGWPGKDNTIRIWDLATDQQLFTIKATGQVGSVEISPDGKFALCGSQGNVFYIEIATGTVLKKMKLTSPTACVAFAKDGKHIFTSSLDGFARRWDLEQEKEVNRYKVNGKWCRYVAELPDGQILTVDSAGMVQFWDVAAGTETRRFDAQTGFVCSAMLVPGGREVLVAGWGAASWDLAKGEKVRLFTPHGGDLTKMAFSPDGKKLLTTSFDGTVRLWNFEATNQYEVLHTQDEFVFTATFSPDSRLIAAGGGGLKEGKDFRAGSDHDIRILDISPLVADAPGVAAADQGWPWWAWALIVLGGTAGVIVAVVILRRRGRDSNSTEAGESLGERRTAATAQSGPIVFHCPDCGATLKASAKLLGKKVKCPKCGTPAPVTPAPVT